MTRRGRDAILAVLVRAARMTGPSATMKVLVVHTLPAEAVPSGRDPGEFDLSEAAQNIAGVLTDAAVAGVRGTVGEVLALLAAHQPDVVFNACEAPLGRPDLEPHIAALLELLGVRFTGNGSATLALCRRKDRTNAVLAAMGVPVPRQNVFPCIVKPAGEDGSAGIHAGSICADEASLARVRGLLAGPVVVEEFLPGREFVVALWGRTSPEHVSIGETRFLNGLRLNTYASKWDIDSADFANSPISYELALEPTLHDAVVAAARAAWVAVEARGYMRVDVRLNGAGQPCVLDVNPNPELGPGVGICRAVQEAGWSWERFVRQQVAWA
jgi:D-alanine-D-alanine ligase